MSPLLGCSKFLRAFMTREWARRCRVLPLTVLHRLDGLVRCPDRVCEKRVVDERSRISIAPFRVLWPSSRIFRDRDLETLLKQFAQMRFDAHVGEHSA